MKSSIVFSLTEKGSLYIIKKECDNKYLVLTNGNLKGIYSTFERACNKVLKILDFMSSPREIEVDAEITK